MNNCYSFRLRSAGVVCSIALAAFIGCSDGSYTVDPVAASKAAMEQYDKSGDGLLDKTELKGCPALLRTALVRIDESKDKQAHCGRKSERK